MLPRRLAAGLLALGLLTAPLACSDPKSPTLHVASASFEGVDLRIQPFALRLLFNFKVSANNPNSFDIKVRKVRGRLQLASRYEVPVELEPDSWLPGKQITTFDVPIAVPIDTGMLVVRDTITLTCIPYIFDGSVDVLATSTFELERNNFPLRKESCLPRIELLKALKL